MEQLQAKLDALQIAIVPEFTGEILRNDSQWFVGRVVNGVQLARFGDWRTGDKGEWCGAGTITGEELMRFQTAVEAQLEADRAAKRRGQELAAQRCQKEWEVSQRCIEHPYIVAKGLGDTFTAKTDMRGNLLVDIRDVDGKLWNIQRISPEGEKRFTKGAKKRGCFHKVKWDEQAHALYVCEGWATAASVAASLAPGCGVVAAMDAGNLEPVCQELRKKYANAKIVVCGDNDASGVGQEAAWAAGKAVGGWVTYPEVQGEDFNDMYVRAGADAVRRAIQGEENAAKQLELNCSRPEEESVPEAVVRDAVPVQELAQGKKTDKPKITEKQLAEKMLSGFDERILKQGRALFLYDGRLWQEVDEAGVDHMKNKINAYCGGVLDSKKVDSAWRTFMRYVPPVPKEVNLFNPNPRAVNFENGTLHLIRSSDHQYKLEFKSHNRLDFITNILPYRYDASGQAVNKEFEEMLERVFQGDLDKAEKIRAVRQMYGACLVSAWPHFFMLHGIPKTGKSTVIQIAERLVCKENRCSVEPHEFNNFNMESMVGKLVNSDPDIETHLPITENQIKKVIDRREFRIKRKNKTDAYGYIPGVHIFGGNDIPPTLDGHHKAHDRRWTFIKFNNVQGVGKYDKEYWEYVWDAGPEGIVAFAIEGLKDLCGERGHYLNPESGVRDLGKWQGDRDLVEQFFLDAANGEAEGSGSRIILDKDGKCLRSKLWDAYASWAQVVRGKSVTLNKHMVFERIRNRGFEESREKSGRYFLGIRLIPVGGDTNIVTENKSVIPDKNTFI